MALERQHTYSIDIVMPLIGKFHKVLIDGDYMLLNSPRLLVFKKHGIICRCCYTPAIFFAKERTGTGKWHFNLYGYNRQGEEIRFTQDHITPISKGGKSRFSNLQVMCKKCNTKKGNTLITPWALRRQLNIQKSAYFNSRFSRLRRDFVGTGTFGK
jgi:hypothetical protein